MEQKNNLQKWILNPLAFQAQVLEWTKDEGVGIPISVSWYLEMIRPVAKGDSSLMKVSAKFWLYDIIDICPQVCTEDTETAIKIGVMAIVRNVILRLIQNNE